MARYYNMRLKKYIYINGVCLDQLQPVLPEVLVMDFGIDNTTHPLLIRRRLERIRQQEISCD
jgi:hypothetical protein